MIELNSPEWKSAAHPIYLNGMLKLAITVSGAQIGIAEIETTVKFNDPGETVDINGVVSTIINNTFRDKNASKSLLNDQHALIMIRNQIEALVNYCPAYSNTLKEIYVPETGAMYNVEVTATKVE